MVDTYSNCLTCPITFSLFCDPVIAEDGHTYERSSITEWITLNGTSPLTRTLITIEGLRPNHLVKSLVDAFQKVLTQHYYKFKLGIDIIRSENPFFQTNGKCFFDAQWIGYPNGPPIVLLKLVGARAKKEASFYEHLTRHPHIVYTYGLVEPSQKHSTFVMLLQEKAPLGSLFNLLEHRLDRQPEVPLSDILLNHIFLQITDAMIFLTEKNIIHGDLACRNILVFRFDENEPNKILVKLTDFGISRGNTMYSKIDAGATAIDIIPIRAAAPEVLDDDTMYSEKSDMYAMGVLMWEVYSNGKIPWEEINKESLVREKVINGERLSRPDNCKSDEQWELILKCMSQNPDDRPTFQELEKRLKELINQPAKPNTLVSDCCTSKILTTIKQQPSEDSDRILIPFNDLLSQKKPNTSSGSSITSQSIIIDKTEQMNSHSCPDIQQISSSSSGVNVKDRLSFFEKLSEENRLKSNPLIKTTKKPANIERTLPKKELIKLTKWQ